MHRTAIKLCGMMNPADIADANLLLPEYVGFVFYPPSHRNVSVAQAMAMRAALKPSIQAVGVFVDAPVPLMAKLVRDGVIDIIQLHGHEDNAAIEAVRAAAGCPIWQAVRLRTGDDAERADRSSADLVLLDGGLGEGKRFDWSLCARVGRPFFLAGGLDADNARDAVRALRPAGVDVSSGIESNGRKDADKMRRFVQTVRNADERS